MGEVYKARDPRLGREIAIKVLPAEVASDPERFKRFEREARAASALSHPNIVTVFDVGTTDSVSYMAIELVDGKTLRDLLLPGPLPIRKLLDIAVQVADGLAAAHEMGIVHRDLKPQNVMVSQAAFVKILDFGLAKVPVMTASGANSRSDTIETPQTSPGVLLGTTEYMSPEQARGKPLDFRSDQFSFGTMLYEMVTGRRAFARGTHVDTLTAILQQEPTPIAQLRPDAPAPLRWIIERCLAKSAPDRYASTRDLARELQALKEHIGEVSGEQAPSPPVRAARLGPRALVAGVAVLAIAGVWSFLSGTLRRRAEPDFRRLTFRTGYVSRALFSPKSNTILYTAAWEGRPPQAYTTLPESAGSDRVLDSEVQLPMAFSSDGSQALVLLGAPRLGVSLSGTLGWWPVLGGQTRRLLENVGWSDWAPRGGFLVVVRDVGGERQLQIRDEEGRLKRVLFRTAGGISFVRVSPDERWVAFIHHPTTLDIAGAVSMASLETPGVRSLTRRFQDCFGLAWNSRTGEIWFTASVRGMIPTSLWSVTPAGKIRSIHSFADSFVLQDVSRNGEECLLLSRRNRVQMTVRRSGAEPKDLSWFDYTYVSDICPDDDSLVFYDGGSTQQMSGSWKRRVDGGDAVRIGDGEFGRCSPDGRWIVALSQAWKGAPQLVLYPTGIGQTRQLTFSNTNHWAPTFAGPHTILFVQFDGPKREIWRMETDGTGAKSLGAEGCDLPMAHPAANSFLCIGAPGGRSILEYPLEKGTGRKICEISGEDRFRYARWSERGDRILAVTSAGRMLVLRASDGKILREERLPMGASENYPTIHTAALNESGTIQAYSVASFSAEVYLASGLR